MESCKLRYFNSFEFLDHTGTEPTGSTKLDDDHDGMQQKGENVEHAQDGIRPKKLKIQGACGIRHPQQPNQWDLESDRQLITRNSSVQI